MNARSPRPLFALATFFLMASLTGCATGTAAKRPAAHPGTQEPRAFSTTVATTTTYNHLIFLPREYADGTSRRWPLMVFLHGAGERGTNLTQVTVHGPPKLAPQQPDFPFVLVSPQCAPNELWDPAALDALLDHLLATYAVDPDRVYLTGLSMGGNGTWAWATRSPHRFAAIAPICGWGDPIRVWLDGGNRRTHLARLPIWAFHGARDNVVPLSESQRMTAAFERVGNKPKLSIDPEAGHDSWTAAYRDPALYTWFLAHRLPQP